ncbi:MAG: glycoside hydrolase family 16 protein [Paludibacter sp.]|nr:glycoside hydrolase family 16 protein [Paludibacter sp.]
MKHTVLLAITFLSIIASAQKVNPYLPDSSSPIKRSGMKLVFSEEFNYVGKPDSTIWNYETGFKRNNELQWYQSDNANCSKGRLLIEGKKTDFPNPNYSAGSENWKTNREKVNYTAASITTSGKKSWKFGRFEVRARVDTTMCSWPAIWLLGVNYDWPSCGEIDMLEFYRPDNVPTILANVACGTGKRWNAKWDSSKKPLASLLLTDKDWVRKYHVWRMDWTKDSINLYVDQILLNTTLVSDMVNADGTNPFLQPQYMLLNLALGSNGGDPSQSKFPITFEVDYVRVYQQE